MFAAIFVLVILPWLDTSKVRSAIFRPLYKQFYWFLVADVLILRLCRCNASRRSLFVVSKSSYSLLLFTFFSYSSSLGLKEKTLEVPLSLTEPVLGGAPNEAWQEIRKNFS